MRAPLRETASLFVNAPRDRVFEVLRREMEGRPDLRAKPGERLEAEGPAGEARTFVLRDERGGTRLIHARSREHVFHPGVGPRDELRAAVQAELLRVRDLAQRAP